MGTETKVAIGCGGCLGLLLVFGLLITLAGGGSTTISNTSPKTLDNGTSGNTAQDPIKIAARELYRAYAYSEETLADAQFKGKYVLIEAVASDTDQIMKAAHNEQDMDNVLNLDTLFKTVPSTGKLNEEARVHEISVERLRGTYPGIDLELGIASSRPVGGGNFIAMGRFGHIHFTFNTHPSDLGMLKRGAHVWIVGQVDGWLKKSVIVKGCKISKKPRPNATDFSQ